MSHTICGIDLGAFSIKLVMLEVGFRQTHLRGLLETAVPNGDAPLLERQAEAIQEAFSQVSAEATPYLALPGDMLSMRLLELPFADPRKIDQVVGYELEGQIVHPLDDVVFDHILVKAGDQGSTVLACAAKRDEIAQYLATLEAHGTEPRALYAAPVVYRSLSAPTPGRTLDAGDGAEITCQVILDLGHLRTNLCIVRDGQAITARTIKRGGFHLTTRDRAGVQLDRTSAPRWPSAATRGWLNPTRPAKTPLEIKLDTVLREALVPLVREIRQTLASFRGTSKETIDAVLITGGTGRLKGLPQFLRDRARPAGAVPRGAQRRRDEAARAARRRATTPSSRPTSRARTRSAPRSRSPRAGAARRSICGAARSSTAPASRCCGRRRCTWGCWSPAC